MDTVKFGSVSESERLLYAQFRRKINGEAARSQVRKLEYDLADATLGSGALKTACADAAALGLGALCVLPSWVRFCANCLGVQRKSSLVACISYPHGGETTEIKVKAVKRALADGADEAEVTIPVAQVREGNYSYLRRELKKLKRACRSKALRIDAECGLLSEQQIAKVCAVAAECGVNSVKTSSGAFGGGNEIDMINKVKSAVKDRCTVKAQGVATILEMSGAIDAGASVIGSKNAAAVARAIIDSAESSSDY